jgi:uncharacterized protein YcgL (UPF0745 family)
MQCFVYKSPRRADTYVFLAQRDDFSPLPEALRERLGALELVMDLQLHPERRLARTDGETLMRELRERGFHLQAPPAEASLANALD